MQEGREVVPALMARSHRFRAPGLGLVLLVVAAAVSAVGVLVAVLFVKPAAGQDAGPAVELSVTVLMVRDDETATYEITLASAPSADVTVTAASSDESVATVSGPVVFGPDNHAVPQSITITAVDAGGATIRHTVMSQDPDYNYMAAPSLSLAVVSPAVLTNLTVAATGPTSLEATWGLPAGWNPSWDNQDGGLYPPCYVVRYREVGSDWHVSEGLDTADKHTCKEGRSPYFRFRDLKSSTEYEVTVRTHDTDWVTATGSTTAGGL